ncbi:MAG: hypothetical protein US30_C0002G0049 [Candidatus Moranbacteria bacterium GW2011_GWF2_36_839]|nr:MAG: hypothetical protein US27_C0003G0049 [Candidatus Moranbacteria bacterium GW2011_GWF1_36_78]KKQ17589.1 MAG: hypothetical protein US30_C0002G0049 [Candidatus Moranbacteria bacterium GW2011_GWF2_36_839]HAT74315.1 hypothetical protein [Candidatus Moranbacteria bacterium]HBY10907.1 hypothetical protein [Candidatus Moranbacteria bacterium]
MDKQKKKIILAISGDIASGKNEMSAYIEKKYESYAYRSSEVLRDILGRMYLPESRENMQKVSTMMREYFGEDIISYVASQDLKKIKKRIIAINGIRRFSDLKILKKYFEVKIIYIDSSLKNRYERICKRLENTDDGVKTLDKFKKDHKSEAERQTRCLRKKADYIIENDESLEEFHREIDKIIKIINK